MNVSLRNSFNEEPEEEKQSDTLIDIKDIIYDITDTTDTTENNKKVSLNEIIKIMDDNIHIVYGNLVIKLQKTNSVLKPVHAYIYNANGEISEHKKII